MEVLPVPVKATILILLMALLCPPMAKAFGDPGCCGSSGDFPWAQAGGFAGGACHPAEDPVFPEGEAGNDSCSCEFCQPYFTASSHPVDALPGMDRIEVFDLSDPSAAVPAEIFRPPLS